MTQNLKKADQNLLFFFFAGKQGQWATNEALKEERRKEKNARVQKETKTDERYRARRALNVEGVSRGRRGSRADPSRCQINGGATLSTLRVRTATILMQFRNSPVLAHFVFALHVLSPCWPLVFEVSVFPLEFRPVCRAFYPSFCGRRQSLISHRRRRSAATHASRASVRPSGLVSPPLGSTRVGSETECKSYSWPPR